MCNICLNKNWFSCLFGPKYGRNIFSTSSSDCWVWHCPKYIYRKCLCFLRMQRHNFSPFLSFIVIFIAWTVPPCLIFASIFLGCLQHKCSVLQWHLKKTFYYFTISNHQVKKKTGKIIIKCMQCLCRHTHTHARARMYASVCALKLLNDILHTKDLSVSQQNLWKPKIVIWT